MQRLLTAAAASLLLTLALVAPVGAEEQHRSCAGFGTQNHTNYGPGALGALISSLAPTGPGVVSGIVAGEHVGFCAPR